MTPSFRGERASPSPQGRDRKTVLYHIDMHYVKFFKLPTLVNGGKQSAAVVKTTVAVSTDLGDDFFPNLLPLKFEVLGPGKKVLQSSTHQWKTGMRALSVEFALSKRPPTCRLRVSASESEYSTSFDLNDGILVTPCIMPVVSGIFDEVSGGQTRDSDVERVIPLLENQDLRIYEATGDSIARHIWDGSVAFSGLIDRASLGKSGVPFLDKTLCGADTSNSFRAIELGAGVGLAGLTLAHLVPGANIMLTDVPEVEQLLERSIAANDMDPKTVHFGVLDWEQPITPQFKQHVFDLILISECTYNEDSIPALVGVISNLADFSPQATILVATKQRHKNERIFYHLMEQARFVITHETHVLSPRNYTPHDFDDADRVNVYTFRLVT